MGAGDSDEDYIFEGQDCFDNESDDDDDILVEAVDEASCLEEGFF